MVHDVLFAERLLDVLQLVFIHGAEKVDVRQGIGGVRVHRERDVAEFSPDGFHHFDVLSRMDFDLRAVIAEREIVIDLAEEHVDILLDAERHAHADLFLRPAEERLQGFPRALAQEIPEGVLHRRLRETVPADIFETLHEGFRSFHFLMKDLRDDHVFQDMEHRAVVFGIIKRSVKRFALAPSHESFGIDLHQQGIPVFKTGEARLERMAERVQHPDDIYAVNSHKAPPACLFFLLYAIKKLSAKGEPKIYASSGCFLW